MEQEKDKKYKTSPDYFLREIAGDSILVCVGESNVFGNSMISLNETSSFLWRFFQTPGTIKDAVFEAGKLYSDPDGNMETHITEFVTEYVRLGLIQEE